MIILLFIYKVSETGNMRKICYIFPSSLYTIDNNANMGINIIIINLLLIVIIDDFKLR